MKIRRFHAPLTVSIVQSIACSAAHTGADLFVSRATNQPMDPAASLNKNLSFGQTIASCTSITISCFDIDNWRLDNFATNDRLLTHCRSVRTAGKIRLPGHKNAHYKAPNWTRVSKIFLTNFDLWLTSFQLWTMTEIVINVCTRHGINAAVHCWRQDYHCCCFTRLPLYVIHVTSAPSLQTFKKRLKPRCLAAVSRLVFSVLSGL